MPATPRSGPWTGVKKFLLSAYFGIGYVCTGIVFLFISVLALALMMESLSPLLTRGARRESARRSACLSNQHQIGMALAQYEFDNDNFLPPAMTWMDSIEPNYVRDDSPMHCPSVTHQDAHGYGYAFNSTLGGRNAAQMGAFRTTPAVYDSTNTKRNANDPLSSLPSPGRHGGRNNILFLDGHSADVQKNGD